MDAEFDPFSTLFKIDSTTLIGTAEEPPLVCSSSTVASITDHQHLRMLKRYTHIKSESLVARLDEVCVQIHFVHPLLFRSQHLTETVTISTVLLCST